MKYIDSHLHLGDCRVFDLNVSEKDLIEGLESSGIDKAVVQPFPGATDEKEVHKHIYKLTQKYPGMIYGLASVNPHCSKYEYEEKIKRYVEEYGFVGIKLHTIGHAVHPHTKDARTVYEIAGKLNVPVNVHTGPGVPFALPSLFIPIVKEYPEIKFVFAHSGYTFYSIESIITAEQCENLYLETSWCSLEATKDMINAIGSERVMMGSDSLTSIGQEINKFQSMNITEEQRKDVFYKTATSVFKLE